jgi:Arylsulfotransferase (ASST)
VRRLVPLIIGLLALAGCGDDGPETPHAAQSRESLRFRSAPDLRPPAITVRKRGRGTAPGRIFLTPMKGAGQDGPMIVDDDGSLVWFRRLGGGRVASDLRVQSYRGEPVLTWWEGRLVGGGGSGEYVIADTSYETVARVRAKRGLAGDLHEFLLTREGTALFTIYRSARGGRVVDCLIQEVDVATGELVFEWSSLDHVPLRHSYKERSRKPWDYFHLNSIDVDSDGDLLVSARNTHAIYKLDRRTGRIVWTLGGKASDFRMGRGTQFAWAHDARRQPDGTITIFDNAARPIVRDESRGLVLAVDTERRRVRLRRAYRHPRALLAPVQAGLQRLPNGNVFIGLGSTGYFSEHGAGGAVRFDARFSDDENGSYRAYRFPWTARPAAPPDVAARRRDGGVTVYASWNGATEVARWRVLAGASADALEPAVTARRKGFETAVSVRTGAPFVAVEALDASGAVLGTSRAIRPAGPTR